MTVKEFLSEEGVTIDIIFEMAESSPYWDNVSDFCINNWDKPLEALSKKQREWCFEIRDILARRQAPNRIS
jgi:hypothetical protein